MEKPSSDDEEGVKGCVSMNSKSQEPKKKENTTLIQRGLSSAEGNPEKRARLI